MYKMRVQPFKFLQSSILGALILLSEPPLSMREVNLGINRSMESNV